MYGIHTTRMGHVWLTSHMGHVRYKAYGSCMGHVWHILHYKYKYSPTYGTCKDLHSSFRPIHIRVPCIFHKCFIHIPSVGIIPDPYVFHTKPIHDFLVRVCNSFELINSHPIMVAILFIIGCPKSTGS